MANKKLLETIRKEIISRIDKRHLSAQAQNELVSLLSFLSTLESETAYDTRQYTPRPSVDIEDVARVQFASHAKVFDKKRKAVFDWEQFKEVAGIFYGFGKKDRSDTLEPEKPSEGLEEEVHNYLKIHHLHIKDGGRVVFDNGDSPNFMCDVRDIARHFYEIGCRHTAEKYDEIEYNRQRAEESEKPMNWEEELNRYLHEECSDDEPGIHEIAEHFAEWGAEHKKIEPPCHTVDEWIEHIQNADQLTKDIFSKGPYDVLYDALNHSYQHCYDAIKEFGELCYQTARQDMMKEAVEGEAHPDDCEIWVNLVGYGYKFNDGDKVRIIIVKEDEK